MQKPTSSQTDSPASCRRAAVVSSRWERERESIDESTAAAAAISDKEAVIPELPLLSLSLSLPLCVSKVPQQFLKELSVILQT